MIGWIAVAWAADPPLDPLLSEVPPGVHVTLSRDPGGWTIGVGDRILRVAAPQTPEEEAEIRALVRSLTSGLALAQPPALPRLQSPPPAPRAPVPRPAPVFVSAAAVQAPEPEVVAVPPLAPPPAAVPAAARLTTWVGVDGVGRPGVNPGIGLATGILFGDQAGVGLRLGVRAPREGFTGGSFLLTEATADAELWATPWPHLGWSAGVGVAGRLITFEQQILSLHPMPRASAGLFAPVRAGFVALALELVVEADLAATWIGIVGEAEDERLYPLGLRVGVRMAPNPGPED